MSYSLIISIFTNLTQYTSQEHQNKTILTKYCWKPYHNFLLIGLGIASEHLEVVIPSKSTLLLKSLDGTPHSPQRMKLVLHK